MNETENNIQNPKLCRFAVWSPLLAVFDLLFIISIFFLFILFGGPVETPITAFIGYLSVGIFIILLLVSIVIGILAIYKIHKSRGQLIGNFAAISGILIALFIIIFPIILRMVPDENRNRIVCANRVKRLGLALNNYSRENGFKYPAPDKWCDLIKGEGIAEQDFICPSSKAKKCSYAINPNCKPDSPNDIVLLFETKDGWNQFGGPEMLIPIHKRYEGKSCEVLYNDGRVLFIRGPGEIGKLKWKAE